MGHCVCSRGSGLARASLLALVVAACGESPAQDAGRPVVTALDKPALAVGEALRVFGRGFLAPEQGQTLLELSGVYFAEQPDGSVTPEQVPAFLVTPLYDGVVVRGDPLNEQGVPEGTEVLRWNRFGPFTIPFTRASPARPGTFKGQVRAINVSEDGAYVLASSPVEVAVDVEPSIVIRELQPVFGVDASGGLVTPRCDTPAVRLFGDTPYVLEVEAVGLDPAYFVYELGGANGEALHTVTHVAAGNVDRVGDPRARGEELRFDPLEPDLEFALTGIRITAVGAGNDFISTVLPMTVVRPLQAHYDGNRQLAEYYEPVAVFGPITGGIGTTVAYAEERTEARQRGVSIGIAQTFAAAHEVSTDSSWVSGVEVSTETLNGMEDSTSLTRAVDSESSGSADVSNERLREWEMSSTDGTTWSASSRFGTEQNFDGSIGLMGSKVGVKFGFELEVGSSSGGQQSTTSVEGAVTADSRSAGFSGSYAVSDQETLESTSSYTTAAAGSRVMEVGGSSSQSSSIVVDDTEAWDESWSITSEDATLLSYSGDVPRNRCAVIYRQTVRYVRQAQLFSYNLCGERSVMGEMTFNEWTWSPNIAVGDCASVPPSTQPAARCLLACE